MSYVVPGANPIQPGVQSVSAGTNISISGSTINPIINALYSVVSERASTNTPLTVTALTQATAQTVVSMVLSLDYVSNISVCANFTYRATNPSQYQLYFFLESSINGTNSVIGYINTDTVQGLNHYSNCGLVGGTFNTPVNDVTLRLKVFASTASVLIVQPAQLLAFGNISQD